jgi:hypothetical protein
LKARSASVWDDDDVAAVAQVMMAAARKRERRRGQAGGMAPGVGERRMTRGSLVPRCQCVDV